MDRLKYEMDHLHPFPFHGRSISFVGFLSMIDAAMLNYYTENISHWRCSFCFLLPREFRLVPPGCFILNGDALDSMALSILHFPLRVGDHLLKIGYSQDFKKARVSKIYKDLFDLRKEEIQLEMQRLYSLLIDVPLSKGGNSMCGNVWRQVCAQ